MFPQMGGVQVPFPLSPQPPVLRVSIHSVLFRKAHFRTISITEYTFSAYSFMTVVFLSRMDCWEHPCCNTVMDGCRDHRCCNPVMDGDHPCCIPVTDWRRQVRGIIMQTLALHRRLSLGHRIRVLHIGFDYQRLAMRRVWSKVCKFKRKKATTTTKLIMIKADNDQQS